MKKENFSLAVDQVLKSNSKITVQKVTPEKKIKDAIDEKQVSFYIEKELLKKLKMKALEEGLNFKESMTMAIIRYLE